MAKNKKQSGKGAQAKKNIWMQAGVIIVIAAFLVYFIFANFIKTTEAPENTVLDKTLNSNTAYSFNKQGELSFTDSLNQFKSKIDIEIADDDDKRMTGLMFRDKLAENQGMLFIFPEEDPQSFWMKNTVLPLDIIFVNAKQEIVKIHKNTTPYSEQSYASGKPAQYVVEVNAGYCEKNNIKEGDKIVWRR